MQRDDAGGSGATAAADAAATDTLATERLVLRRLAPSDAPFVRALVNDPDWLRYIGDKGVRTDDDARGYLERGPIATYARHGFGLYLVARRCDMAPVGICGLIKRDSLPDVDIGFAFLPAYRGAGYAVEAAAAAIDEGRTRYGLTRVVAIASPDNARSIRLLEKLGMTSEGLLPGAPVDDPLLLYALDLA